MAKSLDIHNIMPFIGCKMQICLKILHNFSSWSMCVTIHFELKNDKIDQENVFQVLQTRESLRFDAFLTDVMYFHDNEWCDATIMMCTVKLWTLGAFLNSLKFYKMLLVDYFPLQNFIKKFPRRYVKQVMKSFYSKKHYKTLFWKGVDLIIPAHTRC